MSAIKEYEHNIKRALRNKRPIIHIETSDYDWEYRTICRILNRTPNDIKFESIFRWSPNMHYQTADGEDLELSATTGVNEIVELLDNFTGLDEPNLLFAYDFAFYIDGDTEPGIDASTARSLIISRLYSFYLNQEVISRNDRSVIILICPNFRIPPELQNRIYRLTPPYPDDFDIEEELGLNIDFEEVSRKLEENEEVKYESPTKGSEIVYKYTRSFFGNDEGELVFKDGIIDGHYYELNKKRILSAFKGMRLSSIQILLSYNEPAYTISGANIKNLGECKERMVKDSGLLKLEKVESGYQKYVGDIDGLRSYLEVDKAIILNREIYSKMGKIPMPKGLLLVGPPGCGKSETSKAIADILGIPLLSMDMGKLSSKWVGESEHNFENAIALAEAAQPCVLRIDELEKAFANTGKDSGDDSGMKILGFFLTWMQERSSMVYLVATANDLSKLRPEFLRKGRWNEIFYLSYPSAEGMAKIILSVIQRYSLNIQEKGIEYDCVQDDIEILDILKVKSKSVYDQYPKNKISGAVIADTIERVYRKSFVKEPICEVSTIELDDVFDLLTKHAAQVKDPEIERQIQSDMKKFRMDYIKTHHPLTELQTKSIRDKISAKYTQEKRCEIIEIESNRRFAELCLDVIRSHDNRCIDRPRITNVIKTEFDDNYFSKLIEDEVNAIVFNHFLNNELDISPKTLSEMEIILREQYEMDKDIENFYKSKGYISASKGFE